jgi:hypothetical protein
MDMKCCIFYLFYLREQGNNSIIDSLDIHVPIIKFIEQWDHVHLDSLPTMLVKLSIGIPSDPTALFLSI